MILKCLCLPGGAKGTRNPEPGGNEYTLTILSRLASQSGWQPAQVAALRAGQSLAEPRTDALLAVVREAASNSGRVSDATWSGATQARLGDDQLAEAYAYLGWPCSPATS